LINPEQRRYGYHCCAMIGWSRSRVSKTTAPSQKIKPDYFSPRLSSWKM